MDFQCASRPKSRGFRHTKLLYPVLAASPKLQNLVQLWMKRASSGKMKVTRQFR